jgi:NAD(P)H-hydrate epimerase
MTALVTPAQMRAAEASAIDAGVGASELMRAAGHAVAEWIDEHIPLPPRRQRHAIALVGPGNNGGDALVALARLVELGWRCSAQFIGRASFGDLPSRRDSLESIEHIDVGALLDGDVILDGVFGIGGRTQLPAAARAAFSAAHAARGRRRMPLVAVDVPSGVDAGSGAVGEGAFQADITLCLGLPKIGLVCEPAASHVGELYLLTIGIPEPAHSHAPQLMTAATIQQLLRRRPANAHKSNVGSVLVVGGAPTYYGAPRLAGAAAARVGAGLVTLAVPEQLVPVIAAQTPEMTFVPLPTHDDERATATLDAFMRAQGDRYTAAVVGPGLGRAKAANQLLDRLFAAEDRPAGLNQLANMPLVVDADGLNWLAEQAAWPQLLPAGKAVLTPHPGEMARLSGGDVSDVLADPLHFARAAAMRWRQTVVLKSGYATVAAPDGRVWVAPRATPELATAGTGDVLAGAVGGMLAQGLSAADAACAAVFIGAMAGRQALARRGVRSVVARDAIEGISSALDELLSARVEL